VTNWESELNTKWIGAANLRRRGVEVIAVSEAKHAEARVLHAHIVPTHLHRFPGVSGCNFYSFGSSRDGKTTLSLGDGRDLLSLCPVVGVV